MYMNVYEYVRIYEENVYGFHSTCYTSTTDIYYLLWEKVTLQLNIYNAMTEIILGQCDLQVPGWIVNLDFSQ